VLDEPSSYLDLHYQIELLEILRRLAHDRGVAIVMSMHDLSLARQASDWLVCVRNGVVLTQGTPDQVCCASTIDKLYDLKPGTFDPLSGTIAMSSQREGQTQGDGHA
jgi:iron complex transport system ATP-binding protein